MTASSEPTGDDQARPVDPSSSSNEASSASASPAETNAVPTGVEGTGPAPDDGLPEWEPLTPELVEDEAIRGDFVIRWAAVGLALLFGFSQIADTRTLVHIRSGEYMASNGFLPPATDVFTHTASDRRWVNLSWLFDLGVAAIHGIGGGIGLSVVQGLLAALAFGLVAHSHRSTIRTWWGSICTVLALLVCYPQITMQPELITLVGLSAVLFIVFRAEETSSTKLLWSVVPILWVWSQLDSRAFLGLLLLICFTVGEVTRRDVLADESSAARRLRWWKLLGVSVAAIFIHPFLWESWLAPWRLYAIDYPAMRQLFPKSSAIDMAVQPIWFGGVWEPPSQSVIASIVLFAAALIVLFLNRERVSVGHVLAALVFTGLGCVTTHELAAASLVNCAICSVNAQDWYRRRFGQVYSIDWRELLFSRGGRALTVIGFFALAWLIISGRIDGPDGKRTGVGFDQSLAVLMETFETLASSSFDDRPFHFTLRQGDLVIWSGQKAFVDSRAGLFSGRDDRDLIDLYMKTRRAIQRKREQLPGSGEPDVWKATFDKYQMTHAMPRLTGPNPAPDYVTFGDLLSSNDWVLTDLSAATAVFYRNDNKDPKLAEYVKSHQVSYIDKAFRSEMAVEETTREWAREATAYDNLFSLRKTFLPLPVMRAQHFAQMASSSSRMPDTVRAALAICAIRDAMAGLRTAPNAADGYIVLARAHLILDQIESTVMSAAKTPWNGVLRYQQAIAEWHQAALLRPDDLGIRYALASLFERNKRSELSLEEIRIIKKLQPISSDATDEVREQRKYLDGLEVALEEAVSKIDKMTSEGLAAGADRMQVALAAYQMGGVLTAIRILEEDAIYKEQNLAAKALLGTLLLEAGRVREAHETLEQVEVASGAGPGAGWRDPVALSALANSDLARAITLWRNQVREVEQAGTEASLSTLPFLTLNPYWVGSDQYPLSHTAATVQMLEGTKTEATALRLQVAMTQLEWGDAKGATETLRTALQRDPASPMRPLLRFYLLCTTDELIAEQPEQKVTFEEFDALSSEPAASSK